MRNNIPICLPFTTKTGNSNSTDVSNMKFTVPKNCNYYQETGKNAMALTWYRHFQRNGGLNKILRRQISDFQYG
jgi:hypothetical protein